MKTWIPLSAFACLMIAACNCAAASTVLSGYLNDPANTHLVGSDLGLPLFGDEQDTANNVALYQISIASDGDATFTSTGFGVGGVDPYFTLFAGTGPTATVLGSNYAIAFSTGGDFSLVFPLLAGDYTVAIGTFANMSLAENFGSGSLGDGFTALGVPFFFGNGYYNLVVSSAATVPEPASITLLAIALLGSAAVKRMRQNQNI